MSLVLLKFTTILLLAAQFNNCCKNDCILDGSLLFWRSSVKVVSSTYLWSRQSTFKSSIRTKKVSGPNQEPWNMAPLSGSHVEWLLPARTRCYLWSPMSDQSTCCRICHQLPSNPLSYWSLFTGDQMTESFGHQWTIDPVAKGTDTFQNCAGWKTVHSSTIMPRVLHHAIHAFHWRFIVSATFSLRTQYVVDFCYLVSGVTYWQRLRFTSCRLLTLTCYQLNTYIWWTFPVADSLLWVWLPENLKGWGGGAVGRATELRLTGCRFNSWLSIVA